MTLDQFQKLTAHLPGDTEMLIGGEAIVVAIPHDDALVLDGESGLAMAEDDDTPVLWRAG